VRKKDPASKNQVSFKKTQKRASIRRVSQEVKIIVGEYQGGKKTKVTFVGLNAKQQRKPPFKHDGQKKKSSRYGQGREERPKQKTLIEFTPSTVKKVV